MESVNCSSAEVLMASKALPMRHESNVPLVKLSTNCTLVNTFPGTETVSARKVV